MAGISLAKGDQSDPLVSFADRISVNDDSPSTDIGVAGVESPDSPGQIHQLSEMAWKQLNPEQVIEDDDTTETTSSTPSGGGLPQGSSGVNDMGVVPGPGSTDFGSAAGGNYVTDDAKSAETIVKVAKAMLGKPYVWGGEDWSGADCSGLVQLAYAQAGIAMPRLSNYQMNKGKRVDYKNLKPGDLVGWNNSNHVVGADHIAIYIGNNQIIEAPRPGASIRVSGLYDYDVAEMWAVRIPSAHRIPAQRPKAAPKPKPAAPKNPGTPSIRAIENQQKPAKKAAPKQPKSQADMHSTGKLAVRN